MQGEAPDGNGNGPLMRFRLGEFIVDANARTLRRADGVVVLAPRTMDVLVYLAKHQDETVSNQDLLNAYWRGAISSTNAVHKCAVELRKALGDDRAEPRYIVTMPRRGYRLIASVEPIHGPGNGNGNGHADQDANTATPDDALALEDMRGDAPTPTRVPEPPRPITTLAVVILLLCAVVWYARAPTALDTAATAARSDSASAASAAATTDAPVADGKKPGPPKPRIAILAVSGTGRKEAELASAIRATLLSGIGEIDRLWVVDAAPGPGTPRNTDEAKRIAAMLKADFLVSGRVASHGDGIAVQLTLHRGGDGVRMYGYERTVRDRSAVVGEASAAMFEAAEVLTDPGGEKAMADLGTKSPKAFLAMREGLSARMLGNQAGLRRALAGYRRAIAIDPGLIIAYVQFAADAPMLVRYTTDRQSLSKLLAEVQALRRLMLPHRPKAADVQYFDIAEALLRGDAYAAREARARAKIAALKPGEPCLCYVDYLNFLMAGRLYDEAEGYRLLALQHEPGSPYLTLMARGSIVRLREGPFMAKDIYKQTLTVFPNDIAVLNGMVTVLAQTGEFDEAQQYLEHLETVDSDGLWAYSARLQLQAMRGDLKPGSATLKAALADARALPITDGIVLFTLGDVPGGVDAWSRLTPESFETLAAHAASIETTFPRSVLKDARYQALMERLGIGASWTAQLRRNVAMLAPISGVTAGPAGASPAAPILAARVPPPAQ